MIIPISIYSKFKKGDEVILIKNIYTDYALFCKGHILYFEKKVKDYSLYILIDKDGNELQASKDEFTLKSDIKTTEKEWYNYYQKLHFENFMSKSDWNNKGVNCPNIDFEIEDRDYVKVCKLKKTYNNSCKPNLGCTKYLNLKEVTDKKVLEYIRKSKINRINKK